jgi:hypothetical protein
MSREQNKGMPTGGPQTTKKGDKGYTRKQKHKGGDVSESEELNEIDETYRGLGYPIASLNWSMNMNSIAKSIAEEEDDDETKVVDTPGFPPTKEGGGNVPDKGAAWGSSIVADLNWSTHKSETFNDTGKDGGHPAWGLKSVIDRGVKPHEKPNGDKRIGEAEHQVTKRNIGGKKFKSFSHVLDWS